MSNAPPRRPPPLSPGAVRPAQHQDGCEDAVAQWSRNPLLCWLCDTVYEDPRLLSCYHAFCGRCIGPRILEGRIFCPLCCKVTLTKDGQLPPRDNLMVFLVESSCEERPICANCDNRSLAVFFCNTCGQALCGLCREETHRARMFSTHDIIHMSKRGREVNKKCALHGEPYIMFSATKHAMLCINCFRESSVDARLHCTDLETAYNVGCKKLERGVMINPIPGETLIDIDTAYSQARQKLDRAAMSIRELQNSVRDGVILFNALLEELRKNMDTEKNNINNLAETIQENVRRMQEGLLREVDTQYDSKDKQFRSQLSSLGSLLPIIQVHLLMCTTFSSSASKFEFLDLVFQLMERLAAIAHLSHPLRPGQSSQIRSNYRSEFYRGLEPLLSVTNKSRGDSTLPSGSSGCSDKPQSSEGGLSRPPSSASVVGPQGVFGLAGSSRRSLSAAKLKIFESGGPFADHCKVHETRFRDLSGKFSRLKEEAQELHRDVTLRRCMTRRGRVEEIVRECASLEDEVRCYGDEIEELRAVFDSAWDEQIQRVYSEQEVFQSQVNDIASLRDENKRLMIIAQQLEPYIRSITALMERISPKLQVPATQMLTSSQICMMDNTEPNNVVMQQILDQITSCSKQEGNRSEGRGVGDGSSRGGVMLSDDGAIIPTPPQPPASSPGLLPDGIPKPPDPPHMRRSMDAQNEDQHGYSPGQVCGRSEIAALGGHHLPHHILPPGPPDHQYVNQLHPGTELMIFRKRQHSEGESVVYRELPWVGQGRRGSEGSEVEKQRSGGTNENSQPSSRPSSKERQRKARGGVTLGQRERAERLLEQAVASFDASAIPERPKSACENTILYQHIYGFGSDAMRHKEGRKSDEGIEKSKSRSRESSGSRPRSAEREQNGPGAIVLKALKSQTLVGKPPKRSGEISKIHALVHADGFGRRQDNVYAVATVPRRPQGKKENIYENVVTMGDTVISRGYATISGRPFFRKQSSLDTLPSGGSKVYRGGSMGRGATTACAPERRESGIRKADSFEGHEEAVRTLVAQVQKNRILRRKEVK